jgi:cyclopropane-fatty-acyl-phospholipid synthase
MAGFAYAFERGWVSVYQIVAARPLPNGAVPYPLAREQIYASSSQPSRQGSAYN